ncbi:HAD-like domain-containing protein [Microdochium bolleyi]|uniref:HAD-like domain-containing protein n=1 Tax=Microdochium bolleyi TaxID=196109 RepID=A0A136J1Q1_9PEZI|nr:HAD-like domain-containing protein [Microdochium bolleyi]
MRRFMSTMAQRSPRRFAPLRAQAAAASTNSSSSNSEAPKLQGIVFDVDGTLCKPQNHMFGQMRQVLGIPKSVDILEHVYSLPPGAGPGGQEEAMQSIRDIESAMMVEQEAQPGLAELMAYLDSRDVRKGICTRNFAAPVEHLLGKFLEGSVIAPVVTRDFRPPKPDPAGILFIAKTWGLVRAASSAPGAASAVADDAAAGDGPVERAEKAGARETDSAGEVTQVGDASRLIMVGDSIDDMTAGRRAGAATVLLVNDVNRHLADHEHTDLVIEKLDELIGVLEEGFTGRSIS